MCEDAEAVAFDVLVYDPDSQQAVMVRTADSPAYPPATIQGVLRRDAGGIAGALEGTGWDPTELEFQVSPRLILVEGATAPSGLPLLLLAVIAVGLAGLIALGIAGGYVMFRPESGEAATPVAPVAANEAAIPLRVTGRLQGVVGTSMSGRRRPSCGASRRRPPRTHRRRSSCNARSTPRASPSVPGRSATSSVAGSVRCAGTDQPCG